MLKNMNKINILLYQNNNILISRIRLVFRIRRELKGIVELGKARYRTTRVLE